MDFENENIGCVWDEIKGVFGLEGLPLDPSPHLSKSSLELLQAEQLCEGTLQYLLEEVEFRLRVSVVPAFWKYFSLTSSQTLSDVEKAEIFQKVI